MAAEAGGAAVAALAAQCTEIVPSRRAARQRRLDLRACPRCPSRLCPRGPLRRFDARLRDGHVGTPDDEEADAASATRAWRASDAAASPSATTPPGRRTPNPVRWDPGTAIPGTVGFRTTEVAARASSAATAVAGTAVRARRSVPGNEPGLGERRRSIRAPSRPGICGGSVVGLSRLPILFRKVPPCLGRPVGDRGLDRGQRPGCWG